MNPCMQSESEAHSGGAGLQVPFAQTKPGGQLMSEVHSGIRVHNPLTQTNPVGQSPSEKQPPDGVGVAMGWTQAWFTQRCPLAQSVLLQQA